MAKKLFGGKETYAEELKEAKALKSGKISARGFARGEKSEGHKGEESFAKTAKKIKSGKMSPSAYAKMETKEHKGMAAGGSVPPMKSAGAGRGFVNPKTIAEMQKRKKKGIRGGVWTDDSDVPAPENPDMGSVKLKKGGSVFRSAADGIAKKGRTHPKFI